MTEFQISKEPSQPEDYEWPSYSDKGFIIVNIPGPSPSGVYKWDYEVEEYDGGSSVSYISEGTGFDWWFDNYCDFPGPGKYRVDGISGEYIQGDRSYGEDDDEEWEFERIVRIES